MHTKRQPCAASLGYLIKRQLQNHLHKIDEQLCAVEYDDRAANDVDDAQYLVVEFCAEQR